MNKQIETQRLLLRPLAVTDAADVFAWVSDPEVNRYMVYLRYTRIEDVEKWLRAITPEQNEFAFVLKSTGKVIGSGSIRYEETWKAYVFGYNVNRAYWGNGYATEAAKAMIAWARCELGAEDFAAIHADANIASGKVIRKCGLTVSEHTSYQKCDGSEVFPATCLRAHFPREDK